MGFENLTTEMQNLVLVNFEFFGKLFLTLIVFALTASYIFYFSKRFEPTPYFLVSILRGVTYFVSWIVLTSIPLWILFFYPQVSLEVMLRILFIFYTMFYLVVGIIFFVNIMYITPVVVMKYGGLDVDDSRVKTIIGRFEMFNELAKYGKKGKSAGKRRYVQRSEKGAGTSKTA